MLPITIMAAIMTLTSCLEAYGNYFSTITNDNPAGYWRLNEAVTTSGSMATNYGSLGAVANGVYEGTIVANCPGSISAGGDSDASAGFNAATGSSNQVVVPFTNSAVLSAFSSKTFSFEAWAKVAVTNPANYQCVLAARVPSPTYGGFVMYSEGNPADWQYWLGTGSQFHTMATFAGSGTANTNWTHIVGTYDGTNQALYVNGTVLAVQIEPYTPPNSTSTFQIGMGNAANAAIYPFSTNIDEVAFYTNALTPSQILKHYVAGTGANPPATLIPNIQMFGPEIQTNYTGYPASISVTAGGTLPFTYQWYYAASASSSVSNAIPGATNATFTISSLASTNQGAYWVTINNSLGSYTSSTDAWLQVITTTSPTFTTPPQSEILYSNGTAHFSVVAGGAPHFNYQWQSNNINISGATNAQLVIPNVQATSPGTFDVAVGDIAGTNSTSPVSLTVLPLPATNVYPSIVMADQPVAYWRLGIVDSTNGGSIAYDLAGGFNGTYNGPVSEGQPGAIIGDPDSFSATFGAGITYVDVPFVTNINTKAFTVETWVLDNGLSWGFYRAPLANHTPGAFTGYNFYGTSGNDWQCWMGIATNWNTMGGTTPVLTNIWTHLAATYDGTNAMFYVNGALVASAHTNYSPNAVEDFLIGVGGGIGALNYYWQGNLEEVAIYNTALSSNRIAAHYQGGGIAPVIIVQPCGGSVLVGSNVTLTVSAIGSLPLAYQWQQAGANLSAQTNASLPVLDLTSTNPVSYDVIITNRGGSVTSSVVYIRGVTIGSTYSNLVLADGAVGFWPLNESTGTTANNQGSSGSVDNGNYENGVTLGFPGPLTNNLNTAAGFMASNDTEVALPYDALLNGQAFTVEAWAEMTGPGQSIDDGYQAIYNSRASGYEGATLYGLYGGDWIAYSGSGSAFTAMDSKVPVQIGQWAYTALTYDGATQRYYVNGVLVFSTNAIYSADQASQESIGTGGIVSSPEYYFEGNIADVAVYNTCLPATSIQAHYAIGTIPVVTTPPTISITPAGKNATLTWSGGTLVECTNLAQASWFVVSNVVSPLNIATTNSASFFRVMQ